MTSRFYNIYFLLSSYNVTCLLFACDTVLNITNKMCTYTPLCKINIYTNTLNVVFYRKVIIIDDEGIDLSFIVLAKYA